MAAEDFKSSPFLQFESWHKEAKESTKTRALNPDYASLATCSKDGKPSSRVLATQLQGERGFLFNTHNMSRKAQDLGSNPNACLLFYWSAPVIRQVRVEGKVERLPEEVASESFHSYPRQMQVGLAVNCEISERQFTGSKADLSQLRKELLKKYSDESVPVPIPSGWIGYLLVPTRFEFYDGTDPTLLEIYDFVFTKDASGSWCFQLKA